MKVKWSKNYFKISLSQEAEAFGKKTEKKNTNATPKITKQNIYWEYLLFQQSSASGSFLQRYVNFVEQRLKFLTLKVA